MMNEAAVEFLARVAVSDSLIDDREIELLESFLRNLGEAEGMPMSAQAVFADQVDRSLEELLLDITANHDETTLREILGMGLMLALVDQYFDPEEERILEFARKEWGISAAEYEQLKRDIQTKLQQRVKNVPDEGAEKAHPFFYTGIGKSMLAMAARLAGKETRERLKQFQTRLLLSGPEYPEAIERCGKIAESDFQYVMPVLERSESVLLKLCESLQRTVADYLEGVSRNKPEYIQLSHFNDFVPQLNAFVDHKGLLGKMDTPFRVVLSELEKALVQISIDNDDKKFFTLLDKVEHRVQKSLRNAESRLNMMIAELRSEIIQLGSGLSSKVGLPKVDLESESRQIEASIQQLVSAKSEQLERMLGEERESLTDEIQEIFDGDLGKAFLSQINHSVAVDVENVQHNENNPLREQFSAITSIVDKASGGVLKIALGNAAKNAGMLFRSSAVAGSGLHKGVYAVGKFFGHNFKPWQAVNIAKNIGNAAKALGAVMAIAAVVLEVVQMRKEHKDLQKVMNAKQECMNQFAEIADAMEREFRQQFASYKNEYYIKVLNEISECRNHEIHRHQTASEFKNKLLDYKGRLQGLMDSIAG